MINASDSLLVLLTKNSATSAWVNQEIGFATAVGKPILPISIDKDIQPYGMFSATQSYSLFDWSDPKGALDRLVKTLHSTSFLKTSNPYKQLGFDHVIDGKVERTKFITNSLQDLQKKNSGDIEILYQAAYSIFSVSNDPMYQDSGEHSDEYIRLLLKERQTLDELVRRPYCKMKMILCLGRNFENKHLAIRYSNLLSWMKSVKDDDTINFVCAQFPGPNKLIIMGDFMVEGYKHQHHAGYPTTVVKYQTKQIQDAAAKFHQAFGGAGGDKVSIIKHIAKMYKDVI